MLKQWSKGVLDKWIDVYTLVIKELSKKKCDLSKECIEIVLKMSDMSQTISVRVSSAYFLGSIARNQAL